MQQRSAGLFLGVTALSGLLALPAGAATLTTLYQFQGGADGGLPVAGLTAGTAGKFYGATTNQLGVPSCASNCGAIFELTPPAAGGTLWTKTTLHSFSGPDGSTISTGGLLLLGGSLYGTTFTGGSANLGVAFRLSPPPAGQTAWVIKTLHAFAGGSDGANPNAGLVSGKNNTLFGVTYQGGAANLGTVFQLTPPAPGHSAWTETTLYSFAGGTDGSFPYSNLTIDSAGNLYGTTRAGGGSANCDDSYSPGAGCGTVFELSPPANGQTAWIETVLHAFGSGNDGRTPVGGLVLDPHGNLIGTTQLGGNGASACTGTYGPGCGTIFRLSPPAAGGTAWTETVLHTFTFAIDGAFPNATLTPAGGTAGAYYGTVPWGGPGGVGTAYKVSATGQITLLHAFAGGSDGSYPFAGLTKESGSTALYGTTYEGGAGSGVIYAIAP